MRRDDSETSFDLSDTDQYSAISSDVLMSDEFVWDFLEAFLSAKNSRSFSLQLIIFDAGSQVHSSLLKYKKFKYYIDDFEFFDVNIINKTDIIKNKAVEKH